MPLNAFLLLLFLAVAACSPRPDPSGSDAALPASETPTTETPTADSLATESPAPDGPPPHGEISDEAARTATPDPPTISTVRMGDGVLATLTFRSEGGVSLSDSQPLVFVVDGEPFEAPLDAGPARFTEPSGMVVDQASYTLSDDVYRALLQTSAEAVTIRVADGDGYRDFPYVSGDLIE